MKPEPAWSVPLKVWTVFQTIRGIVDGLPKTIEVPSFLFGIEMAPDVAVSNCVPNCEAFVTAFARLLDVDAHYGIIQTTDSAGRVHKLRHAWLTVRGEDPKFIIDPWPLGVVSGPAIFIQDYAFHFGCLRSILPDRESDTVIDKLVSAMQNCIGTK